MSLWDDFTSALIAQLKRPYFSISRQFTWTGYTNKEVAMPPDQRWVYFTEEEVNGLDPEFVAKLDMARKTAGVPFVITSGLRTPEKNQSVIGAVPDSSHLKGVAVDLRVETDREVSLIVDAAKTAGITRRGIYVDLNNVPTHIHLDTDPEKPVDVIWIKREGQPNSPPATV